MKLYSCGNCNNLLYFENSVCLSCMNAVGFNPEDLSMITLRPNGDGSFTDFLDQNRSYRYCSNFIHGTCNWIIDTQTGGEFCKACAFNRTIPDLVIEQNFSRWKKIEVAKHRLIFSLICLQLPLTVKADAGGEGMVFDFLADEPQREKVTTGHDEGVITINIEEADDDIRARNLMDLGERYRTLLGHFRHETGHYYWDILVQNRLPLADYRKFFGNEETDYSEALKKYYETGAPANWMDFYISPYASAHPWEDWAETWAHYLHMMDTLETAYSFGIRVQPRLIQDDQNVAAAIRRDPYQIRDLEEIIQLWLPLCFAVNSLNRSMGHQDFYPFVISKPVVEKLAFIHQLCRGNLLY